MKKVLTLFSILALILSYINSTYAYDYVESHMRNWKVIDSYIRTEANWLTQDNFSFKWNINPNNDEKLLNKTPIFYEVARKHNDYILKKVKEEDINNSLKKISELRWELNNVGSNLNSSQYYREVDINNQKNEITKKIIKEQENIKYLMEWTQRKMLEEWINTDYYNYIPIEFKKPDTIYNKWYFSKDDIKRLIKKQWTCFNNWTKELVEDEINRFFYIYINYIKWENYELKEWDFVENKYNQELFKIILNQNITWYQSNLEKFKIFKSSRGELDIAYLQFQKSLVALDLIEKEFLKIWEYYKTICEELEGKKTTNIEKKEEIKTIETTRNPEFERVDKVLNELYIQYWSRLFSIIPALEKLKTTDKYKNKIDLLDHIIQKINSFKR